MIAPRDSLAPDRFDRGPILKRLAELKAIAASIPHQDILINTLGLQEAKDSAGIENIATTHRACPGRVSLRETECPEAFLPACKFVNPICRRAVRLDQAGEGK